MILENTLLVSQLQAGHVYQDVISNLLVSIISANGTTATGKYYNAVTGTFEAYTPNDYDLRDINPNPAT